LLQNLVCRVLPIYQIEQGRRELTIAEAKTLAEIFNIFYLKTLLIGKVSQHKVFIEKKDKTTKGSADLQIRVTRKNLRKI